jgi:hypothetical protein
MPQTSIQKQGSIRFGSTKLEVGPDFLSLVNLGALRGMSFNQKVENVVIEFDNTESIKKFKKGLTASFTFQLAEMDMTTYSIIDDGLVVLSNTAGVLVAGAEQVLASGGWAYNSPVIIANQNGDGSVIDVNSVTASVNGALVANTDYFVGFDGQGNCVITLVDSATITTLAQTITIDYDYTPNASKNVEFNDFGTKIEKVARITNTDENGKRLIVNMTNVTNITPTVMPFLADNADDVMTVEIELEGTIQDIIDEQSVV